MIGSFNRFGSPALFALLLTLPLSAQTTGGLIGVVSDDKGEPLWGATVTIESPSLIGGPRSQWTDTSGRFAFTALAVGAYTVRAELNRYAPQQLTDVEVRLKRTTQLHAQLSPVTVEEQITVRAESLAVDPLQVSQGQVFDAEYLKLATIGVTVRDYLSVIKQSPGVVDSVLCSDDVDPSVFGSLENENLYIVDGANSTLPHSLTWGRLVTFDAIEQISLETAGYEAEYGGTTGGVISLVTKSGGNEFSGSLDFRNLSSDRYEDGDHFDPDKEPFRLQTLSATLGGPIRRDRLWFFTAIEATDSEVTPHLSESTRDFEGYSALGKLTWQATESWSLVGQFLDDPVTIHNVNAGPWVRSEATQRWDQGGPLVRADLKGVLTNRLTWNLRSSYYRADLDSSPESADYDTIGHYDCVPIDERHCRMTEVAYASGVWDEDRGRNEAQTGFLLLASPKHSLKAGLGYAPDYRRLEYNPLTGYAYYSFLGNTEGLRYTPPGIHAFEFEGDHFSAFLQDSWRIRPRLTAKLGLRWDEAAQENDVGERVSDFSELQPRLGFAWQITGDGKSVARASWGRFMHPDSLRLGAFAQQHWLPPVFYYYPCSLSGVSREECQQEHGGMFTVGDYGVDTWIEDPEGLDPAGFWLGDWYPSGYGTQIAPGLKPMYAEQLVVGIEREVARRTAVEVSFVDKATRNIFEDTCSGNYPRPSEDAECFDYIIANLPGLRRDYRGWILRVHSQAKPWFHLIGSYTYSKSRGNVQAESLNTPGFDVYPEYWENSYGYLADDRRNRLRINGYFLLPWESTLALETAWMSEFPWTLFSGSSFTEPRGSRRTGKVYWLNLQLSKAISLGRTSFELIGTVNNVFDDEHVMAVCEWEGGCSFEEEEVEPGEPIAFTQPRSYEFGVRIEF
jgi:hypothetical protein